MMTTLLRFLLMLMLLPRHLHLPMKMLDAAVLVEDLTELLLNKLLVVDVQGTLEEGLIRDPPQPKSIQARTQKTTTRTKTWTRTHPHPSPTQRTKEERHCLQTSGIRDRTRKLTDS